MFNMFNMFKTKQITSDQLNRLIRWDHKTRPNISAYNVKDKNLISIIKSTATMIRRKLIIYFKNIEKSRDANAVNGEEELYKTKMLRMMFSHRTDPHHAYQDNPYFLLPLLPGRRVLGGTEDDPIYGYDVDYDTYTKEGHGDEGASHEVPTIEEKFTPEGLPALLCCSDREIELIILFTKAIRTFRKFDSLSDKEVVFIIIHLINSLMYLEPADDFLGIITRELSRNVIRHKNRRLGADLYWGLGGGGDAENLTMIVADNTVKIYLSRMFVSIILNLNTPKRELVAEIKKPQLTHSPLPPRSASSSGSPWSDSSLDSSSDASESHQSSSARSSMSEPETHPADQFSEIPRPGHVSYRENYLDKISKEPALVIKPGDVGRGLKRNLYKTIRRKAKTKAKTTRKGRKGRTARKGRKGRQARTARKY